MNEPTDQQLLQDYLRTRSEAAFTRIVHRYLDLVYSAALRQVSDCHTAQDVAQSVFVALAQQAPQLTDRSALAGWLHGTARNLAIKTIRADARRRAREQEAALMTEILSTTPEANWEHIAPHLDEALGELSEPDRDAVLLRYFKNHDLRTVGATLGISDDAAQKRVSRAVERLREFFAKRGVTVGASGLAVVLSANAVQAAPVGLTLTISTAAALTGTTLATTATVTATKAIAMTALQKTIITATMAVLVGAGIYEARQASHLRGQVQTLQQQQASLAEQIQRLQADKQKLLGAQPDYSANEALLRERDAHKAERARLLTLRNQATMIRSDAEVRARTKGMEQAQSLALQQLQWTNTPVSQIKSLPLNAVFEMDSLNALGSTMPEDTLQSYLSALHQNDYDAWLKLKYTPEYLDAFEDSLTNTASPDILAKERRALAAAESVSLWRLETQGDSQAGIDFNYNYGEARPATAPDGGNLMLKKIGDDWKVIGIGSRYDHKTVEPSSPKQP